CPRSTSIFSTFRSRLHHLARMTPRVHPEWMTALAAFALKIERIRTWRVTTSSRRKGAGMATAAASTSARTRSSAWTGWIAFAGWMMIIIGGIDFFEGLIAVIRGHYYVLTPTQIIVFNVTTWGWITLLWGIVLVFAGFALLAGRAWGRWFAIVAVSLNFLD